MAQTVWNKRISEFNSSKFEWFKISRTSQSVRDRGSALVR